MPAQCGVGMTRHADIKACDGTRLRFCPNEQDTEIVSAAAKPVSGLQDRLYLQAMAVT